MFTFQALQILLFLIPGFLASFLLDAMANRRGPASEFGRITEALILSLIAYTPYGLLENKSPISLTEQSGAVQILYDGQALLLLVSICILIPILLAVLINHDLHFRLARTLRLTRRTSKSSVWFDAFHSNQSYVILDFEDGRRLYGWPTFYSDDPDVPFVYLENAHWIVDSEFVDIGLRGILVTPQESIEFIEYLDYEQGG